MYYRVTINTITLIGTSLSGGLLAFMIDDINKIYVKKPQ